SHDQKIDQVTFSTVTSTVINQHDVNIIMNTSHINQLTLDGIPVSAASFTPMTYCSTISYAQLPLTQGSHTLAADSGFTAYVYGSGSYESYAYSVGSYSKTKPIHVDSIFCTSDTVNLGTTNLLYGIWWSTDTDPNDTISTSPVLTLTPPIVPNIYIEHGNEYISGCEKIYYFNVEVPDPPQVWITAASDTACLNQQVQLNAGTIPVSSIYQYSWTPVTGLSNPNIANPVATATTSLWYYVAISTPNGCAPTVYDSIYLNVLPLPLPNVGSNPATICLGDTATITASGGVTYLWNPGGYTGSSISVSPVISTNYIVYVTDTNGCGNSDTVSVTVNPLPSADAGADQSICTGANATLSATGGVSYLWTPGGAVTSSITVSPLSSTNYIVQVTGANGCSKNDSVYITVNPLPLANAGPDEVICSGASVTLSASGGTSYLWTPGGNITSSILVSPLSSTNYIVKVTDLNGCENSDTVNVAVNPIPVANTGADQTICSGAFATLTATGGAFYLWAPGGSTSNSITVSPGSSTNYIVTVSDSIGCQSMDTVHVTVNLLPAAYAGPNTSVCMGESVTLNASPAGASYLWTPSGSTNSSITVSPAITTSYILQVTDSNGCQKIDSVLVTVNPAAVANAGADQSICSGFQATLTASGGVSYLWTPGGGTTSSITVSPATTTNYIVKVTDSNGCEDYDTVLVAVTTYITGSASTQAICLGSSTTLNASGGVSYLWIPGGNTTSSITVSPQTSSNYIVHITTSIGCLIYDTIHVNVNPLPLASAGSDQEICFGSNTTLTASGGTSYLWITNGSTNASIIVSPASGQNYIVHVTDNNGCKKNDTVYVAVNPLPLANAGADHAICPGASATLTATGGISYLWTPGGSTNASIIVSPVIPTTYIVLVTDINGCQDRDTTLVTLNPVPLANFSVSLPVCENSPLSFNNSSSVSSGSITYNQWNFGDGSGAVSENAVHSYAIAGSYSVTLIVASNNNCIDTVGHIISVNPNPVADFSTQNICVWQPDPFNDLSTVAGCNIVQWFWDFGDGSSDVVQSPFHIYSQAGMYDVELTVTSDSGCAASRLKAQAVEIYPLPEPHFKVVPEITSIFEPVIHFIDQSTNGMLWQWNFGDSKGSSDLPNPFYSYNDTGTFNVSMILTSNYGCVDSAYGEVYIVPDFAIYFPNAFTPNGDNRNDFYSPEGIGMSDFDIYIFDRWGNELFHSDNILFRWDGKARPGNLDCSEGIYAYLAKATDYKKIRHQFRGIITLVR
ncbi:MAG TPA: PKD domain-containing protein, partial [Bacteroidia bacterium]|nr:PKD domain-containing protein [Bacteroidia bacterium]